MATAVGASILVKVSRPFLTRCSSGDDRLSSSGIAGDSLIKGAGGFWRKGGGLF